jgi:hypothetical protein
VNDLAVYLGRGKKQRENPGPWMISTANMLRYDPRRDTAGVPYFALID